MAVAVARATARVADFLRDHAPMLRKLQWGIVALYIFLLVVPAIMPLPDNSASVFNNLTIVAQFAFWGIWWPFVLVSMPIMGRAWCGLFCPEGMLTEWASERGQGHAIPKWMRWGGWPFVAFSLTTIYGQLVSVYQYPLAVLVVLGGSTAAAMVVGWRYGRSKRVWCKYLCPVNGVFNLLAKLSPWHFKVDEEAWRSPVINAPVAATGHRTIRIHAVNCAPLVPLRHMKGAGDCHMCGRCSGYRGAIALTPRSPEEEIVHIAKGDAWQTALVVFGLMGIAVGAFLWSASPWYVTVKQWAATWLINRDIMWPLLENAPWFVLTHYPDVNDVFSWLDGACILLFIFGGMVVVGGATYLGVWIADRILPSSEGRTLWGGAGVHKLTQALIPAAGIGVFLGLSATTITLLRHEGVEALWANPVRFTLLTLALAWTLRLAWRVMGRRTSSVGRKLLAWLVFAAGLAPFCIAWVLFFVTW